jgi:outer membrane lipoprotein-sorting protein
MKKSINFAILLSIIFVAFSCSKEKQLEKSLSSKSGTWNVASQTITGFEGNVQVYSQTFTNSGTMVFNSDGSGTSEFTFMGMTEKSTFTWTTTSEKLTIVDGTETMIFDIKSQSKTKLELEGVDQYTEDGIDYKTDIKMVLEKK